MSKSVRAALLVAITLLFLAGGPAGQDKNKQNPQGNLSGVVISLADGAPMPGAEITIVDLGLSTETDMDGMFSIDLPPGTYEVKISKEDFIASVVRGVVVKSGEPVFQDVALNPQGMAGGQVTVYAEADQASKAALLAERRAASVIRDSIGAEEMKESTGSNAADALQKVTGVTIVEDKFVYVRGLGERYSNTMLNGAVLPSTQPDKRVVPMDLFPTALLENIQTEKSFTPDQPGEFSGGLVKLNTVSHPRSATLNVSYQQGFGTNTSFQDFMTYPGNGRFIGADSSRALPSIFPTDQRLIRATRFTAGFTPQELQLFGRALPNIWEPTGVEAAPNTKFSILGGNTYGKLGAVFALSYINGYHNQDEERTFFRVGSGGQISPIHNYDFAISTRSIRTGLVGNLAYDFNENHRIGFKNFYSHDTSDEARIFQGFNGDASNEIIDTRLRFVEEGIFSSQVTGEHNLSIFGNSLIEWQLGRSRSTLDEPDLRETLYEYSNSLDDFRLADESQSGFRMFNHLADEVWEPSVNWTTFITRGRVVGSIKVGGLYRTRDRDFNSRRFRFRWLGRSNAIDLTQPQEDLFAYPNIKPTGFELREETRPTDTYEASQINRSGFAMADFAVGRWRFVGGLRVESDTQSVTTFDPFNRNNPAASVTNLHNTDLLPAINAIYKLNGQMNLRGSFSQTVNRPQFRELAPFEFTDVVGGRAVFGNPDLLRALIQNYDVRWEWFPQPTELISFSFFYKDFQNPIERVVRPTAQLSTSFINADGAQNFGFEVDYRRSLGSLWEALSSFFVSANYTFVDSQVDIPEQSLVVLTSLSRPLEGQSRHVVNANVEYRHPSRGTILRGLFNYQGRRISDVGALGLPDIYAESYPSLNFVLIQPLDEKKKWELKFSAENLLDEAYEFTQGGLTQRTFQRGRFYAIGISFRPF